MVKELEILNRIEYLQLIIFSSPYFNLTYHNQIIAIIRFFLIY